MRAPISVIIPTLNAAPALSACLASLVEGLEAGLIREVIVSDGGSSDSTCKVAQEWGTEVVTGPASRGGQLQRGCDAAQGEWLLILHADTRLAPGWVEPVEAHLRSWDAAWFQLAFDGGGLAATLVAGWANKRSQWFGLPFGDQGLLLPQATYDEVGGYSDQPLMEDVALARALGGSLVGLKATAITNPQKYRKEGWMRRGARNLSLQLKYFAGVPAEDLAKSYQR